MTDKERLEEAKLMAEMLRVETRLPHDFPFDLVDWLVEQAERVEELESEIENWQEGRFLAVSTFVKEIDLKKRVHELEEENKRIRQMKYYEAYEHGKFDTNMKVWHEVPKIEQQNKRYREAIEYIQREIHKAIYTPKKQKWSSDFEREFERGKTRGLIQASDIFKEAIEALEGEE